MGASSMSSIWYAKPSDGYLASSAEGTSNIRAFYDYLYGEGFVYGAVVGMLCNVAAESGYNPWRWEGDVYGLSRGYGLFQFTPGSAYINASGVPDHYPNLSTSQETSGSSPDDAKGQLYCFVNDTLSKWNDTCWRSYWDPSHLPDYYDRCQNILALYGQNGHLSIDDFKIINNIQDASDAFLACYEGPAESNVHPDDRYANHVVIEEALEGYIPQPPTPGLKDDILILKHFIYNNRKGFYL
jgi:hypothetical protein